MLQRQLAGVDDEVGVDEKRTVLDMNAVGDDEILWVHASSWHGMCQRAGRGGGDPRLSHPTEAGRLFARRCCDRCHHQRPAATV